MARQLTLMGAYGTCLGFRSGNSAYGTCSGFRVDTLIESNLFFAVPLHLSCLASGSRV